MRPNLFHFATSELSQDALIAYLLSWAKESAQPYNAPLHQLARLFLNSLFNAANAKPPDSIHSIEIKKQEGGIDILCIVNQCYVLLIEDKTSTQEHSNQLARYVDYLNEHYNFAEENILLLYIQTGDQSDYCEVARNGYSVFDRQALLNILDSEAGQAACVVSDILNDYRHWLREIEDEVQSFLTVFPKNWSWRAWIGFYKWLQRELGDGHWDYVANPSGGFLGFWWHFVGNGSGELYLQIEQGKFCFKIWVLDSAQRVTKRQQMHESVVGNCPKHGISAKRPQRFGHGQYMTVALLDQEFPPTLPDGCLNRQNTLAVIHAAQQVVSESSNFV